MAIGTPGLFIPDDISKIHISVAFTWDLLEAERLADAWSRYSNVKIGGPATGMRDEAFAPGMYLKQGYCSAIEQTFNEYMLGIREKTGYSIILEKVLSKASSIIKFTISEVDL